MEQPIIIVTNSGKVQIGTGYNIGQVLDALELARRAVMGVVLHPPATQQPESNPEFRRTHADSETT